MGDDGPNTEASADNLQPTFATNLRLRFIDSWLHFFVLLSVPFGNAASSCSAAQLRAGILHEHRLPI